MIRTKIYKQISNSQKSKFFIHIYLIFTPFTFIKLINTPLSYTQGERGESTIAWEYEDIVLL